MVITAHNVVLIISLLLFIAIFAGQASYKFGVPALIIFLGVGMLAGSEGIFLPDRLRTSSAFPP